MGNQVPRDGVRSGGSARNDLTCAIVAAALVIGCVTRAEPADDRAMPSFVRAGSRWLPLADLEATAARFAKQRDQHFDRSKVQASLWIYPLTNSELALISFGTTTGRPFWNVYFGNDGQPVRLESGIASERVAVASQCEINLRTLRMSIEQYREDRGGAFPPSLNEALESIGRTNLAELACPTKSPHSTNTPDLAARTGYYYVNWSKEYKGTNEPPGGLPLLYDYSLSNHTGGVNVICIDGTPLWDPQARKLSEVAAEHPLVQMHVPK